MASDGRGRGRAAQLLARLERSRKEEDEKLAASALAAAASAAAAARPPPFPPPSPTTSSPAVSLSSGGTIATVLTKAEEVCKELEKEECAMTTGGRTSSPGPTLSSRSPISMLSSGGGAAVSPRGRGTLLREMMLQRAPSSASPTRDTASGSSGRGAQLRARLGKDTDSDGRSSSLVSLDRVEGYPSEPKSAGDAAEKMGGLSLQGGAPTEAKPKKPVMLMDKKTMAVNVTANFFQLSLDPGKGIFFYEVKFTPTLDALSERFSCVNQHRELIGRSKSFDGTKLFLPSRLPSDETELKSTMSSTGESVKVTLLFKRKVGWDEPDAIQHLNILFRRAMSSLKMVATRRNFYMPEKAMKVPQHKLEVWPGFVTAVAENQGGLQLQVGVVSRCVSTCTVHDLMRDLFHKKVANIRDAAERALLGTTVMTRYNHKFYMIDDILFDRSPKTTFAYRGTEISLVQYYHDQYGITVKDHDQPLLLCRKKEAEMWLLPELCYLTGLPDHMRNDFRVMSDIGAFTRLTPDQSQTRIKEFVTTLLHHPEAGAHLSLWGLRLTEQTEAVQAKLLEPETLIFGSSSGGGPGFKETVAPNADWTRTATSKPCLTPVNVNNWILVVLDREKRLAEAYTATWKTNGSRLGISVANPFVKLLPDDRQESYAKAIRENLSPNVQLVVTIVPSLRADRYALIKKLCYVEHPVASQVILAKTLKNERKLTSVVQKIMLQINCKLGGELWGCHAVIRNLMVIGIDAAHDTARKEGSVYGFVASMYHTFSRWFSTTCVQRPNQELADALKVAMSTALQKYYRINHAFPTTIIVFRDGVGDGQLDVLSHELDQFRSTFTCIGGYQPDFTFVVVQKRINTKIFAFTGRPGAAPSREARGKFANPAPGVVVDSHVTMKSMPDFFLVSQNVNQGTVSPTHYIVRHSTHLPLDAVQRVAYQLTHMYYNWPGTIKVPAPCLYAHKVAGMASEHLGRQMPNAKLEDRLFYL